MFFGKENEMLEKYLKQTNFSDFDDFKANYKLIVPDNNEIKIIVNQRTGMRPVRYETSYLKLIQQL